MGIIAAQALDTDFNTCELFSGAREWAGEVRRILGSTVSSSRHTKEQGAEKTGVQGQVAQCSEAQNSGSLDCELSEGQYVSHSVVVHKDSSALCPTTLM